MCLAFSGVHMHVHPPHHFKFPPPYHCVHSALQQRWPVLSAVFAGNCNFDNGLCTWTKDHSGDFDWISGSGQTASQRTGPTADHTSSHGQTLFLPSQSAFTVLPLTFGLTYFWSFVCGSKYLLSVSQYWFVYLSLPPTPKMQLLMNPLVFLLLSDLFWPLGWNSAGQRKCTDYGGERSTQVCFWQWETFILVFCFPSLRQVHVHRSIVTKKTQWPCSPGQWDVAGRLRLLFPNRTTEVKEAHKFAFGNEKRSFWFLLPFSQASTCSSKHRHQENSMTVLSWPVRCCRQAPPPVSTSGTACTAMTSTYCVCGCGRTPTACRCPFLSWRGSRAPHLSGCRVKSLFPHRATPSV